METIDNTDLRLKVPPLPNPNEELNEPAQEVVSQLHKINDVAREKLNNFRETREED